MHYTRQTIAAATCIILGLSAFWPDSNDVISRGTAELRTAQRNCSAGLVRVSTPKESKTAHTTPTGPFHNSREAVEAKLDEPCGAEFFQMPLREVLADLSAQWGIAILFDPEEVGDVIDPDVPIDIQVGSSSMSGKTLLEKFILAPNDLVYTVHENYLLISSYDKSLTMYETVVYDCRDLLATMPNGIDSSGESSSEQQLIESIYTSVRSEDAPWDTQVGNVAGSDENAGTIAPLNGLLIIRQTQAVHEQIEDLLESLRKAMRARE